MADGMTKDDIIKMARDAGSIDSEEVIETIFRAFSEAEREACAKLADSMNTFGQPPDVGTAIRARSNS